jgi:hypothetical protein
MLANIKIHPFEKATSTVVYVLHNHININKIKHNE